MVLSQKGDVILSKSIVYFIRQPQNTLFARENSAKACQLLGNSSRIQLPGGQVAFEIKHFMEFIAFICSYQYYPPGLLNLQRLSSITVH